MKKKIAINGFGRIGRLTMRKMFQDDSIEVVAINDLTDVDVLAHLFEYDSAHGRFKGDIRIEGKNMHVNGQKILSSSEKDPTALPWGELGVDVVLECTGVFTSREGASKHLTAGAGKVIISAPAKGDGIQTIVLGVNDEQIDASERIYSNASCTTNCFAPVVKIIDEAFGIERAMMTTIHAYTQDQNLQDGPHRDLRRARAAAINIVPTSTGAAKAVEIVYPKIKGKMEAAAVRVPVITGSLIDLTCALTNVTTVDEVKRTFRAQAEGPMKGILEYSEAPLVSTDIIGNPHSAIFDAELTTVLDNFLKVVVWYDNEAGYSARLSDICARIAYLD